MGNLVVPVDDSLYSTLKIGSDAFPFFLSHDDLSNFVRGFVNWHKQKEIEISYILEGSVRVCLLNEEHLLRAGDSFVILPDALHSLQPIADEPGRYFTLIFDPCLLTGFSGSFFEQQHYSPVVSSAKGYHCISGSNDISSVNAIRDALFWIYQHEDAASGRTQLEIQRKLQDIWLLLTQCVFPPAAAAGHKREDRRILSMLEYLRAHYAEKFSLDVMAEHHHVSRGECCRYFKKMMGMTITQFLLDYRLSKAAQWLTLTQMSITDIAHNAGFRSASNFSEEFKQKTGQTPSEYRSCMTK
ncbi:MAG: helix-turn-helix transcriptional regulator [Clostridia bacterium]|nr:helix-turn-helix transcriptional regulator [Clostridia bacterium]